MFRMIALAIARFFMQVALDASSKQVLSYAVKKAEESGLKGSDKMKVAVDYIKKQGTESLKTITISRLHTLIEQTIDKLGV